MPPTRVAIIGAGIAGPVLAMILKQKGYDPVLYERTESVNTAGLSLVSVTFRVYPPSLDY